MMHRLWLLSLGCLLLSGEVATAKNFSVIVGSDEPDANLADEICRTAASNCTLRAAIEQANALGGTNSISISVPVVTLTSALPPIVQPLLIGSGFVSTRPEINGNGNAGLELQSGDCSVSQLAITRCAAAGIILRGNKNSINNCFIGTTNETTSLPNAGPGILIDASHSNEVSNCRIRYNSGAGISLSDGSSFNFGNLNRIESNANAGVSIASGTNNHIFAEKFFGNGGIGVDLGADGPTANDALDPDEGANHLLNHPVITSAISSPTGTTVSGVLNSTPSKSFFINAYSSSNCDQPQGGSFLNQDDVITQFDGNGSFVVSSLVELPTGTFITAQTTDEAGNVSEFSPCVQVNTAGTGANLSVSIADAPDPAIVGGPIVYTISVQNAGPAAATGVKVTHTLSPDVIFVSASSGCAESNDVVTCDIGNLASGANATLDIGVIPFSAGTLTNNVSVSGNESDPTPANNTAQEETSVTDAPTKAVIQLEPPLAGVFSVTEGREPAKIRVSRSGNTNGTVTVSYATLQQTAIAGIDYEFTQGSLSFGPGVTNLTFDVPLIEDNNAETNETLQVGLVSPSAGAELGTAFSGILVIEDDDLGGTFTFSAERYDILEGVGSVIVTIQRSGGDGAGVFVTVNATLAVCDGTASSADATLTSQTVEFGVSEVKKTVMIPIRQDAEVETDEDFCVFLVGVQPTGVGAIGQPDGAHVFIHDDDTASQASFTDPDGDNVTAGLAGDGTMTITQPQAANANAARINVPAADAEPGAVYTLTGTDAATSSLVIKVKASGDGDGLTSVGGIVSDGGLKSISGKGADLVGAGIDLNGPLGSLTLRDILNGADVLATGSDAPPAKIAVHVIGDDSTIDIGPISTLAAASIGHSQIIAPSLGGLSIKGDKKLGVAGDFKGDLIISGAGALPGKPILGKVAVGNTISNALIEVTGNIGSVSALRIIDSFISAGFTPTDAEAPLAGGLFTPGLSIKSVAVKGNPNGFVNSIIAAAQIGAVKLSSVQPENEGNEFGVIASESIGAVSISAPPFKLDTAGAPDQSVGDFHVITE